MILRQPLARLIVLLYAQSSSAAFDLFGLRKSIYNPRCAHACREPISTAVLDCTSNLTGVTSPQCYATDDNFLQTLAYCISRHCKVDIVELEEFWKQYTTGWQISIPAPKYDYETAVQLAGIPTYHVSWGQELKHVSVIFEEDYEKSYASLSDWTDSENLHTRYA